MRLPLYPNLNMIEPKYTPQLGAAAVRLLREGKSFSVVGRALGVHRDTIKNWGKRYDPELGKAVVEAKQRWGREKSMNETLEYLEQNPLQEPDMEEPLPPSKEELEREKWRRIFQDMEERSHKQMLEEERALAEQVDIPPEMRGIWLG